MGRIAAFAAALMLAAPPGAEAAKEKGLPTIDLQARCKRSEAVTINMIGPAVKGTAFDGCLKSENEARNALLTSWRDIPAAYKSFCVRPGDFSASYIEWIACLEMMIDVKKLRAGAPPVTANLPKRCPVIAYGDDGSIKGIVACPK